MGLFLSEYNVKLQIWSHKKLQNDKYLFFWNFAISDAQRTIVNRVFRQNPSHKYYLQREAKNNHIEKKCINICKTENSLKTYKISCRFIVLILIKTVRKNVGINFT